MQLVKFEKSFDDLLLWLRHVPQQNAAVTAAKACVATYAGMDAGAAAMATCLPRSRLVCKLWQYSKQHRSRSGQVRYPRSDSLNALDTRRSIA